jgi:micrococcal nuclease
MKYLIFLLILISGCSITGETILETQLEGPFIVTNVVDGDTVDLNNTERIRLSGINTPETGECYYQEAKDKLKELVLNKEVFLEKDISNKGNYGRLLRYIHIEKEIANDILVIEGYAKVYDKYKSDTKRYSQLKKLEALAIQNNLGVWSCKDPKENCLFVSSKNSEKYHTTNCKYSKRIKQENLICHKKTPINKEFSNC